MAFLQIPFSAQDGTADVNSSIITIPDNININDGIFQVVTTGFNTIDAVIYLQHSNTINTADFKDVDTAQAIIAITSSGSNSYMSPVLTNISAKYYRFRYTKGTNSAGTFSTYINFN